MMRKLPILWLFIVFIPLAWVDLSNAKNVVLLINTSESNKKINEEIEKWEKDEGIGQYFDKVICFLPDGDKNPPTKKHIISKLKDISNDNAENVVYFLFGDLNNRNLFCSADSIALGEEFVKIGSKPIADHIVIVVISDTRYKFRIRVEEDIDVCLGQSDDSSLFLDFRKRLDKISGPLSTDRFGNILGIPLVPLSGSSFEIGLSDKKKGEIADLIARAKVALKSKDYSKAKSLVEKVLALDPQNREALRYLKRIEETERKIKRLLASAKVALESKDYAKARSFVEKVLDLDPNNSVALSYLGKIKEVEEEVRGLLVSARIALESKDYFKAKSLFEKVLALDPQNSEALRYLKRIEETERKIKRLLASAKVALESKDYAKARSFVEKVLGLDSENSVALSYLGKIKEVEKEVRGLLASAEVALKSKDYSKAKSLVEKVLALDPQNSEAKGYLKRIEETESKIKRVLASAEVALESKDYTKAKSLTDEVLDLDPNNSVALSYLERIKEAENAIRTLKEEIRDLVARTEVALELKDYAKARSFVEKVLALDPENSEAKWYLKRIEQIEDEIRILMASTRTALESKNYSEARSFVKKVLALDPQNSEALRYLKRIEETERKIKRLLASAKVALESKDYAKARSFVEKVLGLDSENSVALSYLGKIKEVEKEVRGLLASAEVALKSKDYSKVKSLVEEVLALDPKNTEALRYLERIKEEATPWYGKLRSEGRKLSEQDVDKMILKFNFFDRRKNKNGDFQNDFIDNKDGTVTDRASGLMWQKKGSDLGYEFGDAHTYIKEINEKGYAGFRDWRLPTLEELASLLERHKYETSGNWSPCPDNDPACDDNYEASDDKAYLNPVFDHEKSEWYWTADTFPPYSAWVVMFDARFGYMKASYHDWLIYIKAVRTAD